MRHKNLGDPSLGWAEMKPNWAYAKEPGTWQIIFHCGVKPLKAGTRIRFCPPFTYDNSHNSCVRWDLGTVTASCSNESCTLTADVVDNINSPLSETYVGLVAEVTLKEGCLAGGETITVVLGDQRNNGKPAIPQWLSGPDMPFYIAVSQPGEEEFLPLADYPIFPVYGSNAEKLVGILPSTIKENEKFVMKIKAEDAYTNVSSLYQSPVNIITPQAIEAPQVYAVNAHDNGIVKVPGLKLKGKGTHRITLKDDSLEALSNPGSTEFTDGNDKIFWGEIHAHTHLSDGVGSENRFYEYARDEACLDFSAISEHRGGDEWWPCCIKAAEDYYEPGKFATLLGYETGWGGGHCNIYTRGLELDVHDGKNKEKTYELVRQGKAIIIPHHTNDPLLNEVALYKWDEIDTDLIHVAEICQMRGSFEKDQLGDHVLFAGFHCSIQDGLKKGFRFGFTGGTDNHSGRPGSPMYVAFHAGERVGSGNTCDINKMYMDKTLNGLTAVFAEELTRENVYDALRNRRCYATTGARILLNFKVNKLSMGQEGKLENKIEIQVKVAGTAPLERITVVKNNEDVYKVEDSAIDQEFTWEDKDPQPGSWYYIRVNQTDGHLAWASPIWID